MRLHSRFSTNTEVESEALPRSTRRRFLTYLGVGAASTALVSGVQALSPVAALAATHKGATSSAQFSPTGSASGVNVVLVHGIWADGSCWSRVIPLLLAAGHTVFAPQLPLTTNLQDDVTATLGVLQQLQGPTVLVGHSYGGAVITNAGARTGDALVGEAFWDAALAKAAIVVAVPIRQADGRFLGALTAKLNLRAVADSLLRLSPEEPGDVSLITDQGRLVIRSRVSSAELMRARLPDATLRALLDREGQTVVYRRADGQQVIGALRRVPRARWAAVAELPRAAAARELGRLRNGAVLTIAGLLAGIALMVYVLGLVIVRPLERLTAAAAKVAAGDLTVDLPVGGTGEVGYLTHVFNTLVGRLRERESQAELERLSVTDALTGLYNRRYLMGTLASEAQRSRRLRRPFSVLLADVDHFKQYNDTQGHPAGDAALVKVADILRKQTRAVDCVARYGGEEFLVVLLETTVTTAALVAERIRARVAAEPFDGGRMTISIGVAECPAHGDTPESLIAGADAALYEAKDGGRDRVVAAGGKQEREPERRRRKGET